MKESASIKKNLIAGVVVVVAILILASVFMDRFTHHNQEISVPDFYGLQVEEAVRIAEKVPFRLEIIDSVFVKRLDKGAIFSQNPKAGAMVKKNRRIQLTINSMQPQKVSMPDVVGLSLRQASAEIQTRGLMVGRLNYTEDIASNNVLGQYYNGSRIPAGQLVETESTIDLLLGVEIDNGITNVPYVKGMNFMDAYNAIHNNSLNVGEVRYDNSVETYADSLAAKVYRQSPDIVLPESDTVAVVPVPVDFGSNVSIYLTIDPEKLGGIK